MPLAGIQKNGVAGKTKPEREETLIFALLKDEVSVAESICSQDTSTVWIPDKYVRG